MKKLRKKKKGQFEKMIYGVSNATKRNLRSGLENIQPLLQDIWYFYYSSWTGVWVIAEITNIDTDSGHTFWVSGCKSSLQISLNINVKIVTGFKLWVTISYCRI